jgi:hypothetical protein
MAEICNIVYYVRTHQNSSGSMTGSTMYNHSVFFRQLNSFQGCVRVVADSGEQQAPIRERRQITM